MLIQKLNDGAGGPTVVKDLKEAGSNISSPQNELQTTVMSIRMLPIKTVFEIPAPGTRPRTISRKRGGAGCRRGG